MIWTFLTIFCSIVGTLLSTFGGYIVYRHSKDPLSDIDFDSVLNPIREEAKNRDSKPTEAEIEKNVNKAREDVIKDAIAKQKQKNSQLQLAARSGIYITIIGGVLLFLAIIFSNIAEYENLE